MIYWLLVSLVCLLFASQFKLLYAKYKEGEGDWYNRITQVVSKIIGKEEEPVEEEPVDDLDDF